MDEDIDTTSRGTARTVSALGDDNEDDDDDSVGGGVWVESSRGDEESEAGKTKSHVFTAFDPQGIGHRRMTSGGGDSESVRTGWESWGINANEEPVPRRVRKKRSGRWAKVEVSYVYFVLQHYLWLTQYRALDFQKVQPRQCAFPNLPVDTSRRRTRKRTMECPMTFQTTCECGSQSIGLVGLAFSYSGMTAAALARACLFISACMA